MKYDNVRKSFFKFFLKKELFFFSRGGKYVETGQYIDVLFQEERGSGLGRKATAAQIDRSIRLIASARDERRGKSRSGYVGICPVRKKSMFGEKEEKRGGA